MSCEKEYKEMKIICLKRKTEEVIIGIFKYLESCDVKEKIK